MKLKITETEYEKLPDELKALYTKHGDQYILDLDEEVVTKDEVDTKLQALADKNKALLDEKKKAEREAADAKAKKDAEEGNYKSLYESAQQKISELEGAVKQYTQKQQEQQVQQVATQLASKLAPTYPKRAKLLVRFIKEFLTFHEGKVVVTDGAGNPTVSTIEDLENKLRSCGDYDDLIEAPGGTGGNENGDDKKGGKVWSDFTPAELSDIRQKNPARYEQLKQTRGK